MQEIWGGAGEATGISQEQVQDDLFEKAAQRIYTETSYRSIIRNLIQMSAHNSNAKAAQLGIIKEKSEAMDKKSAKMLNDDDDIGLGDFFFG